MTNQDSARLSDFGVDTDNLHQEETFTDLHAASVRRLTPVTPQGTRDNSRPVMYIGESTLVTQLGPLPVQFEIEASTLQEAFEKFPDGVKEAVEKLNERAKEMAREEASRIVVPTGVPPGLPGGAGLGPGGGRGPGKIILDK